MRKLDYLNFGLHPNPRKLRMRVIDAFLLCKETSVSETEPEIYRLLDHYLLMWKGRKHARPFFQCVAIGPWISQVYKNKETILERLAQSEIYSVVYDLIYEYEVYLYQWAETRKLIRKQRGIADSRKQEFFDMV